MDGDSAFSKGQLLDAIDCYTTALKICPAEEEYAYNRVCWLPCSMGIGRLFYGSLCGFFDPANRPCTLATEPRVWLD